MRQVGVTPLTYHVGEQVTAPTNRDRTRGPGRFPPAALSNNRLQAIPETIRTCRQQTQPAWQGLLTVPRVGRVPLGPFGDGAAGLPLAPFGAGGRALPAR